MPSAEPAASALSPFERGVLLGILVGEGSFGGDGKQPHIALRMHVRHEALFHWLVERVPGSRLYGPYHHGQREYYQWMLRGRPLVEMLPVLEADLSPSLDGYACERLRLMRERYAEFIARADARAE